MLDKFKSIFDDSDNVCSDDPDKPNGSNDLGSPLGVLVPTRCIFTSILGLPTLIDAFFNFLVRGTTLFNLVITI